MHVKQMIDLLGVLVPDVVAFILFGESALLIVFLVAWMLARQHKGKSHHYVMLIGFGLDLVLFKPLMIARALDVYGAYPWPGTNIALHLYLELAVLSVGLAAILFGLVRVVKKKGKMFLPPKGRIHRRLGYLFILFWVATFVVGIRIFAWAHVG